MKQQLNLSYGAIQGTYWMYFAAIMSFASVYLLGKNYTNTEIGVILSASGILAVIMQPLLADTVDRSQKVTLTGINVSITIGLILATVPLFFFSSKTLALSIIVVLIGTLHTSQQPLINSMAFHISRTGYKINFGIARSGGSVAYALLCAILGSLVASYGISVIPAAAVISLTLLLLSLAITDKLHKKAAAAPAAEDRKESGTCDRSEIGYGEREEDVQNSETIGLKAFVTRNRAFIVFTAGGVLLFFHSSVVNTYLIQIITPLGGTSGQMGRLFCFLALLELPGLFFFSRIREKFSCQFMLMVASVAFVIKIFFIYIASSVSFIYVAFAFQLISFPFFLSGSVHLVDEVMEKGEAVKGQSFITAMMTLSNVFANLLGGVILDCSGVPLLLLISTVLAILGTVVVFLTVGKIKPKRQHL